MSEIPEDIKRTALQIGAKGHQGIGQHIAEALLAERERCAVIADRHCHKIGGVPVGDWDDAASAIAAAIRSSKGDGDREAKQELVDQAQELKMGYEGERG